MTRYATAHRVGKRLLFAWQDIWILPSGADTDVCALHRELDEAVVDCDGWPKSIAQDDRELVRRLTDLNRGIAEGGRPYTPFGYLDT